jgi:hypothetical protein
MTQDEHGLAMVTQRPATPARGAGICVLVAVGCAGSFREARITCIEALSTALDLVTAVFTEHSARPALAASAVLAYRGVPAAGEC